MSLSKGFFIPIVIGVFLGIFLENIYLFKYFATSFIKLIQLFAFPLIFFLVANSIIGLKNSGNIKYKVSYMIIGTLLLSLCASIISIIISIIVFDQSELTTNSAPIIYNLQLGEVNFIPDNILSPFYNCNIQQILLLSILISISIIKTKSNRLIELFNDSANVLSEIMRGLIKFSPIILLCFITWLIGSLDLYKLNLLVKYFGVILFLYFLHYIIIGIIVHMFAKVSYSEFYKRSSEYQINAFTIGSSKAVLPITIDIICKWFNVSEQNAKFILPIISSINMLGLSIYFTVSVLFLASIQGISLGIEQYIILALMVSILPMGTAGIPYGALAILPMLLLSFGIDMEYISLIIAMDPLINGLRTALNITGDVAITVIIDQVEQRKKYNYLEVFDMKKIFLLHDNKDWIVPIKDALSAKKVDVDEWYISDKKNIAIEDEPPEGVFFNRMSPSASSRGHGDTSPYINTLLEWLDFHNRKVINGKDIWYIETSKIYQYKLLKKHDINTPRTIATFSSAELLSAVESIGLPVILKYNCGGSGAGVKLIKNIEEISNIGEEYYNNSLDGIVLVQEYIKSSENFVYRMEFIDGDLIYIVKINTESGFELCPADSCSLEGRYCPITSQEVHKFEIMKDFYHPIIDNIKDMLRSNNIEVAGVEMIFDAEGKPFIYDINANTNYNSKAQDRAGINAYDILAEFLVNLEI